jgi:hypothetical protein
MTINLGRANAITFDSGNVDITDTGTYDLIAILECGGICRGLLLDVQVGSGGALGGFKLTRASIIGGTHRDWLVDTDFNAATAEITSIVTTAGGWPNLHQLGANQAALIKLDRQDGVGELGIWAKAASTPTTVRLTGTNVAAAL